MAPKTAAEIRSEFQHDLEELERRTLEGLDMVTEALDRTLEALEHTDVELAEVVIANDDQIDGRYLELHQTVLTLLATQAPVAGDLRLVASLLHALRSIERMGDQCVNIAKLIPLSGHAPPTDADMVRNLLTMGRSVRSQIGQCKKAFEARDEDLAKDLVRQDEVVDQLNRECFRLAVRIGGEEELREWAMTMLLVARALERIGDYTVDIGEQVAFLVEGVFAEFEDASHPERPVPGGDPG